MSYEEEQARQLTDGEKIPAEHPLDGLARGLANGTLSRGRVLKLIGATMIGTTLMPLFPERAEALTRRQRKRCRRQGGTVCSSGTRASEVCCARGTTCRSGACEPAGSCSDGAKNGSETDVDCGGSSCPACANGKACIVDSDCLSGACTNEVCTPCEPGTSEPCYTGPPGTQNVGACHAGNRVCASDGTFGTCQGEVTPRPEVCNGIDDDCDGVVDNGNPGGGEPCNTGLPGACSQGTTNCIGGTIVCTPPPGC